MSIKMLIYIKFSVVMAIFSFEVFSMSTCHEYFLIKDLRKAIRTADVEAVRTLFTREVYSFKKHIGSDPVLVSAIFAGNLGIIQMLEKKLWEERRVTLSPLDRKGSFLVLASEYGNTEIVHYFLEKIGPKSDLSDKNKSYLSAVAGNALYYAAINGHVETVRVILDKNIGGLYKTVIDQWVKRNRHKEIAQMIVNKRSEVLKGFSISRDQRSEIR